MNEQLDDIGKRLPYTESEEYLNNLIDTMTENAILQQPRAKKNRHWGMMMAASAASTSLLMAMGDRPISGYFCWPIISVWNHLAG